MQSQKSRFVAFLLCTFLGAFGLHRFYVGKAGSGVAQLLLSLSVIGVLISGIWVFIDWVQILAGSFTDQNGNKVLVW